MGRTKCTSSASEAGDLFKKKRERRAAVRPPPPNGKNKNKATAAKTGLEEAPWRRPFVFKQQPFTLVHTTSRQAEKPPDDVDVRVLRNAHQRKFAAAEEKPHQMFWAKALDGLEAMVPVRNPSAPRCALLLANPADGHEQDGQGPLLAQRLFLPQKTDTVCSLVDERAAAATLIHSLQLQKGGAFLITGQQATPKQIEENALAALVFSQPFAQISPVTEQDIVSQERRVLDARKRLAELRTANQMEMVLATSKPPQPQL